MNTAKPPIWVVLRAHLAADPRKTGALAVLLVIMIVIYARLFSGHAAPEPANAAATSAVIPSAAPSAAPALPPAPVRIKPDRPLVHELTRDPFLVSLERFAVDTDPVVTQPAAGASQPETQPAPEEQELLLQSTICGALPMAWINGHCIQPGDTVDGFVLERVEPARVILRKDGQVRVLTMD